MADDITSPLGAGSQENWAAVRSGRSCLKLHEGLWGLPEPFCASMFDREAVEMECAAENLPQGLSGTDGRTTIFDWWSIGSIQRLRKVIASEKYRTLDVEKMTDGGLERKEAEVFCKFARAVRLASSDEAICKGTTYDLCYCNMSSDGFDKNRHFAFLRDFEDHTLLVAANFSDKPSCMEITIPQHAFDWMEIPVTEELHPGKTIKIEVAPMDGKVITLI